MLRVNIINHKMNDKPDTWFARAAKGAKACGDAVNMSAGFTTAADISACWGVKRSSARTALSSGKPVVVFERAYLGDRFHWTAVGLNGLNGCADFRNAKVPEDRWQQWRGTMKPWRQGGDYALIVGQVMGDASLEGENPYEWAYARYREARRVYDKVLFRPHPLCKFKQRLPGVETHEGTDSDALSRAAVVITHSSNMGVLAVMEGVPVVATGRHSMVTDLATQRVDRPVTMPDREDWGRRIAYAQWTPDEIISGAAWRHITGGIRHGRIARAG